MGAKSEMMYSIIGSARLHAPLLYHHSSKTQLVPS